jgi:uncharacterized repeat protein (TIGR03803 family)
MRVASWAVVLAVATASTTLAQPAGFKDIALPGSSFSGVVEGPGGVLYGATYDGGTNGQGALFSAPKDLSSLTVLYNFDGSDGRAPYGELTVGTGSAAGYLFGTTEAGGASGAGTVFSFHLASGTLVTLHSFQFFAGADSPWGPLLQIGDYLYGSTRVTGPGATIFRLQINGTGFEVLKSFPAAWDGSGWAGADGLAPGALTPGPDGFLYGSAEHGGDMSCYPGYGCGTVFKLKPDGSDFSVVRTFTTPAFPAGFPQRGLVYSADGWLYGTTYRGVFRMALSGADFSMIYTLPAGVGTQIFSPPIEGADGRLYVAQYDGGTTERAGRVFSITKAGGDFKLHHQFTFASHGYGPFGVLYRDSEGIIFGTTEYSALPKSPGMLFRIEPTIAITGTVTRLGSPVPGVTITLAGSATATTTTDAGGQYVLAGLAKGGNYVVTPSLPGHVFTPQSHTLGNITTDQVADFTAIRAFEISGQVRDLNDTGVGGVTMTLTGSQAAVVATDANGHYAFTSLLEGGSYTVTPSRTSFTFNPGSRSFPNLQQAEVADFVVTLGLFTRYFAEGATSAFFDTRFALLNATGVPTTATVTFQTKTLQVVQHSVPLSGLQRVTVDPKAFGLTSAEFSTVVTADQPVIADRTMTWDLSRGYGSHTETSIGSQRTRWYLAEGATIAGFQLFYLIQNASTSDAQVEVQYLRPAPKPPIVKTYGVPAQSRFTIWVNQEGAALASEELSAVVTSTNGVPILVERAMYLDGPGHVFNAGHESAAVPDPALGWFLAEGATGPFFDLFLLLANPQASDSQAQIRYLLPSGTVITRNVVVPAQSRLTIWVDADADLMHTAVSTTVTVTNGVPVIVERTMWWPGDAGTWHESHNSAGVLSAGTKWGLADGQLIGPEDVYVLIANTSPFDGTVRVTLTFEDGTQRNQLFALKANSRFNVDVRFFFPDAIGQRFGTVVESVGLPAAQIVVERAMYRDAEGVVWAAGSNAAGTLLR